MENSSIDQKPRAVSDNSENHVNQKPPHIRERSFTDIQTIIKKDASTNTTPLLTSETQQRAFPPVPLTENKYNVVYETVIEPDMEASIEQVYKESSSKNMNIDFCQWNAMPVADGHPNQDVTGEERKQETDENYEEEVSCSDELNGLSKSHQTNSHKRNESSWSFGSFFIGPPVELVAEVLSVEFYESNLYMHDDKSTKKQAKSMGKNTGSMKITKVSKVSSEEPNLPHRLPPKLYLASSSSLAQSSIFRSSIFYELPPPGQKLPVNTPKSGPVALQKIKAKLRKLSAEEAQLKEMFE
ncbi:uncharacterized protein LOC110155985 [Boleophthalmus pectinirostris]|uniref:uncharacterized protein LOC110155985 n=1 Tax=Boleophthalmus pectinirostris TaxID=150288 RepID=UPI00242AF967|nr:uncharacterized protein LOC110155985 [Boleophthalmus pectinirostris]